MVVVANSGSGGVVVTVLVLGIRTQKKQPNIFSERMWRAEPVGTC